MILDAVIDDQVYSLNVPDALLLEGESFFAQLDRDMDQGWQMSREWVDTPDRLQRAQIVADKLLTALEKENDKLGMLMAGYLLSRLPGLERVELDIQGEIQNNQFFFAASQTVSDAPRSTADRPPAQHSGADQDDADGPGESDAMAEQTEGSDQITRTAEECTGAAGGLSKLDAMAQAGQDVTKVFKVGKGFRFSVFDHGSQRWEDGPLLKSQEEADRLRQRVFSARYEALQRGG